MKRLVVLAAAFGLAALLVSSAVGEDKDKDSKKDQVVGTWELVKSEAKGAAPPGTTVEFTKDGKMKITAKVEDKEISFQGTYTVDGDKLKSTLKIGDKEMTDTDTIEKVNDKELVLRDKKDQLTTFKRKK